MNRKMRSAGLLAMTALLWPLAGSAENKISVDGFDIHYNAITADTLTPEVAQQYKLQRSKSRGILNVAVRKVESGTLGTAAPAQVDANTVTLTGQKLPIAMKEIKETGAIYYIGEFPTQNQQTLSFAIDVRPQGASQDYQIEFDQQFFTE